MGGDSETGKLNYASVFAGLLLLWPVLALLGGQGFTPLISLAAIFSVPFLRPSAPVRAYVVIGFALLVWVSLSSFWSGVSAPLVTGSLSQQDLSVNAAPFRLIGVGLAVMAVMMALLNAPDPPATRARKLVMATVIAAGLMLALTSLFLQPILAFAYEDPIDRMRDGLQNVLRQANAFALLLPVLLASLWVRPGLTGKAGGALAVLLAGAAMVYLGTSAGLLAIFTAICAMIFVWVLPRSGYFGLAALIGGWIAIAPVLFPRVAAIIEQAGLPVPFSFRSRAFAWELIGERIGERPWLGHGLESTGTWSETFAAHPQWLETLVRHGGIESAWQNYHVIPGHPHNMPLEIWVETGLVGALLAIAAIVAIGLRLPAPSRLAPAARYAAAGLFGAALPIFSFGYSAWNEAFWAAIALVAGAVIILARPVSTRA